MTSQHDKPKRWRPRFSVRTLAIVVTLVCVYFGLWEITKRWGVPELDEYSHYNWIYGANSTAPLIVTIDEGYAGPNETVVEVMNQSLEETGNFGFGGPPESRRSYYLWLFGPRIRLTHTAIPDLPTKQ
ncbi:MAG TPA: hypothetical protein VMM76_08915 [Pirellulaceae bacterium]|nr:hypothetical protein [Pirellulaceae bacterium]